MIRQILPQQLKDKLDAGEKIVLVDVRQPEEHALCHLAGSQLIPLGELAGRVSEVEVPDGASLVVYCHHGVRSLSGAGMLAQAGHGDVYSLSGGIDAWSRLIDPTVRRY
jgi:rhodanese-related sulfurtransferase